MDDGTAEDDTRKLHVEVPTAVCDHLLRRSGCPGELGIEGADDVGLADVTNGVNVADADVMRQLRQRSPGVTALWPNLNGRFASK